jgi:hypothetical protein
LQFPRLVFAAMLIELIFSLPGVGHLFATAIYTPPNRLGVRLPKDYDVITAYFLILGMLSLVTIIATDLIYAGADPRIRIGTSATPLVKNPLTSQHQLVRWGSFHVQVRMVATVILAVVLGGMGIAILHQFIRPAVPSLAGTWSGTVSVPDAQPNQLDMLISIGVDGSGKITGLGYDCFRSDATSPGSLDTYMVSGDTDTRTSVNFQLVAAKVYEEYIGFVGQYPTDNRTLVMVGQVTDQYGSVRSGMLHLQRGGDVNQFKAACK